MTEAEQTSLILNSTAPDFELPTAEGGRVQLSDMRGRITVIDFWSVECAWSQKFDPYLRERVPVWAEQGVGFLAINSNDDEMVEQTRTALAERELPFDVLLDEGNVVADAYGALTTPHIFVIDGEGKLVYRGAIDDRTFRQKVASVNYLDEALATVLEGNLLEHNDTHAYGCTIVRRYD